MAGTQSHWTEKVDVRVLAGGGLLIVAGLLLRGNIYGVWPRVVEGGIYVGCLALLAAYKPLRRMFEALPRRQRLGYEDLNDQQTMRTDAALQLAAGPDSRSRERRLGESAGPNMRIESMLILAWAVLTMK